jgi:hypothetical protein
MHQRISRGATGAAARSWAWAHDGRRLCSRGFMCVPCTRLGGFRHGGWLQHGAPETHAASAAAALVAVAAMMFLLILLLVPHLQFGALCAAALLAVAAGIILLILLQKAESMPSAC